MPSRFHFHGEALAFGGRMRIPYDEVLPGQAPAVLSEIGGHTATDVGDFRYRDFLRFDRAHSEVTGSDTGRKYCTLIQTTVEGLNINDMVTADRVVARLYSAYPHPPEDEDEEFAGEPSIKLIGTRFENLKIAGVPVTVHLATAVFDRLDTHKKLSLEYEKEESFRELFGEITQRDAFDQLVDVVKRWFHKPGAKGTELPSNKGFTEVTLAQKVEAPGLQPCGHVIHIPGFGTIRLATLQITQFTRRVTMIHVHLGCAFEGDTMICEIQDGGIDW